MNDGFLFYDSSTWGQEPATQPVYLSYKTPEQQAADAEFRFYDPQTWGQAPQTEGEPLNLTYKTPEQVRSEKAAFVTLAVIAAGLAYFAAR